MSKDIKDYYAQMPYLRNIDRQVTENVMGWTVEKTGTIGWCPDGDYGSFAIKEVWLVNKDTWPFPSIFCPSENEEHAGLVIDKLAKLGWMISIYFGDKNLDRNMMAVVAIQCNRGSPQTPHDVVQVESGTRPLAICLAALEAVERWCDGKQGAWCYVDKECKE